MDCRDTRARTAAGEPLDAATERHLETCADCRAYRADLTEAARLLAAPAATPERLRADTLGLCLDAMEPEPTAAVARRRFSLTDRAIAAMAVAGTAILIGTSIWLADASGELAARYTVKSVFIQLVIQNCGAALLAPALWPLLRRLVVRPSDTQPVTGV